MAEGKNVNGYGVSLRDFFDEKIKQLYRLIETNWEAHQALHMAADRTRIHTEEQLNDVRSRFVPREVHENEVLQLQKSIDGLTRLLQGILVTILVGLVLVIVNLATR